MPSAPEVVNNATYNMAALNVMYSLFDWWSLWGGGLYYAFSDGNARKQLTLVSDWLLWEKPGLYGGLGYAYASATDLNTYYWTPDRLNRYFAELALRGNYWRCFYNVFLRYGFGKQKIGRAHA